MRLYALFVVLFVAVLFSGCVDIVADTGNDGSCDTCGSSAPDYSNHPRYHSTPNLCGAHVYGPPDFPLDDARFGMGCTGSEQCAVFPPNQIPDGSYCCANDDTCYRGVENG